MEEHGLYRRRHLPHWDLPGATYFITTCLTGSIPAEGMLDLERFRNGLVKPNPNDSQPFSEKKDLAWKRYFARADWWLDQQPAVRHLSAPRLSEIVVDAFHHWAGKRYDLLAYVVMPSHIHWVFRPIVGQVGNQSCENSGQVGNLSYNGKKRIRFPRERIMHSLKRHTARECNKVLHKQGSFWQDESYDRCVRDDDELERIILYVENNPVKAGMVEKAELLRFSSAHKRRSNGIPLGMPIK